MSVQSPTRRGFKAVWCQPALLLAEITWRWCFGVAAGLLAAVSVLQYLNSIPISWREQLLVDSGEPLLALAAVAHALRGSALRLVSAGIIAATAAAVLWIFASALGRLATLRALRPNSPASYRSQLGLSFLRAGLFLAAVLAAAGALILAGFAGSRGDAAPSVVLAIFLFACIWLVWALLNWLLSLASIFVVRDGEDSFGAVAAAVDFIRERLGDVVLTSLPFVLLHYLALAAAIAAGVLVFDLMTRASAAAGWALLAIGLGYFAYADFLYITRLAAYGALANRGEEGTVREEPNPAPQDAAPEAPGVPGAALGGTPVMES